MKKFTTLLLVLALTLSSILGVIPFGAFADSATEITDNSGYSGGIRKKSDGSVLFSPFISPLRELVNGGASVSDYTIDMTFTLLTGENGTEVHTFDTVSAAINTSNGKYFDIFLNGTKGNCGFCPTASEYYDIYVEIYQGRTATEKGTLAFYGTYTSMQAAAAIAESSYYTPTEITGGEEPDVPEITYPISIIDTTTYRGFRRNSSGNILFCPYLDATTDIDGTKAVVAVKNNAATYTASLDIYYQIGGSNSTELVEVASLSSVAIKSSSNGNYLDIELVKSGVDYGFCPVAGQYYTVELNIYDGNGNLVFCDGIYKNVSTYEVELSTYYYTSEVFYAGYQTGDASIRFIGGVSEMAVSVYDKIDLEITFTDGADVNRTFALPTQQVYKTLRGTDADGNPFNAVTVYGSEVEAEATVNAAYLFGYGITGIREGTYSVTIKPVAYIGETAVYGKTASYTSVAVASDGSVTVTK